VSYLIRVLGVFRGPDDYVPASGPQYVQGFDVDWQPEVIPEGFEKVTGRSWFTTDPCDALQFLSQTAAVEALRTQSKKHPLRSDGKPNRPMTSFTVEIVSEGAC